MLSVITLFQASKSIWTSYYFISIIKDRSSHIRLVGSAVILQLRFSKIIDMVQLFFFVVSGVWCRRSCTQASILLPASCVLMDKSLHLDTLHFLPSLKGGKGHETIQCGCTHL